MSTMVIRTHDGAMHRLEAPVEAGGRTLSSLLATVGFPLNTRCGERGLCRGCEVLLREGTVVVEGVRVQAPATLKSCQARAAGCLDLEIPAQSRIEHRPQVGDTFRVDIPSAHLPLFRPEPGIRDTAFAVDIGTTTVVVLLVDLLSGEVLSRAGAFNGQIRFGDNVLTRIDAGREPSVVRQMQAAVITETIAPLLDRACDRSDRPPSRIAGGAIAGNTTMLHLLLGEDPTGLGIAPFTPAFLEARRVSCGELGLQTADGRLSPALPVQLLPGISGYVGADIVSGVYATGMVYDRNPSLLVDIGTNGEVVLHSGTRLFACATAAGPAFEGCGLTCGTRAREGAISGVRMMADPFNVHTEIIGATPPDRAIGICGSAYVDFLSEARRCGLLNEHGRFEAGAWNRLPEPLHAETDEERFVCLTAPREGVGLRVSEVDIAVLLQAKAAIGAGIEVLLEKAGIQAPMLDRVYVAGGFGMHLNVPHAIQIGLLPGVHREQVEVVGNTSLAGAVLALLDHTTLEEMERLRRQVEVVELNLQDGFEDRYIDHLSLP